MTELPDDDIMDRLYDESEDAYVWEADDEQV